jgi:hypothetical protein
VNLRSNEHGLALLLALITLLVLSALGMALTMTTMSEMAGARNYRDGTEALYAADGAIERVIQDLNRAPDWNAVVAGTVTSGFIDGPASGVRETVAGRLDLTEATNILRCGKASSCSDGDMSERTDDRPWGANNPRWQLYASGPVADMVSGAIVSWMYVVVWVGDDPLENDNDPLRDGGPPPEGATPEENPGGGILALQAHAYGPGGVRRVVEVTAGRTPAGGVRILSWRELR